MKGYICQWFDYNSDCKEFSIRFIKKYLVLKEYRYFFEFKYTFESIKTKKNLRSLNNTFMNSKWN